MTENIHPWTEIQMAEAPSHTHEGAPGVFLSHSSADKAFVRRFGEDLRRAGVRIWLDEAEIKVGDSLLEKISDGVDSMDYVAVVLSRSSVGSGWVRTEVEIAMNRQIQGRCVKVLPILVEDCSIPAYLTGKLYADFRAPGQYEHALRKVLERVLGLAAGAQVARRMDTHAALGLALANWTQAEPLLTRDRVQLLATEGVDIPPESRDLVLRSLLPLIRSGMSTVEQAFDDEGGGECPIDFSLACGTPIRLLAWAESHGLADQLEEIYSVIDREYAYYQLGQDLRRAVREMLTPQSGAVNPLLTRNPGD